MSRLRLGVLVPLLAAAVLVAAFGKRLMDIEGGDDPRLLPTVLLNTPVPDMALEAIPGRERTPDGLADEDLKGEVSLVNIWGSWCVACLAEHPMLNEIAKSGVVPVQGIEWRDAPDASLAWLRKHGDPYRRIGQDPKSRAAIAFGVTGAPETFVVDREGVIRHKHIGPITPEIWERSLRPLIAELSK
jgi:cytochrome c biogenesis protein CcmG/thiol:disulfide interchange protein DsbE